MNMENANIALCATVGIMSLAALFLSRNGASLPQLRGAVLLWGVMIVIDLAMITINVLMGDWGSVALCVFVLAVTVLSMVVDMKAVKSAQSA